MAASTPSGSDPETSHTEIINGPATAERQLPGDPLEGTLTRIVVAGLSDQARSDLLSRLPVREGYAFSREQLGKVRDAVHEFDEHLFVGVGKSGNGLQVTIMAPGSTPTPITSSSAPFVVPPGALRIGGNIQQVKLVSKTVPVYPPLAKAAHVQGTVRLNTLIGADGHVQNVEARVLRRQPGLA